MKRILLCIVCSAALLASACGGNNQKQGPEVNPSSGSAAYAKTYPEQTRTYNDEVSEGSSNVRSMLEEFETYPDELDEDIDWTLVKEIYQTADEAGQSEAIDDRMKQRRQVMLFYDKYGDEIAKDVSRKVDDSLAEDGTTVETRGAIDSAMQRVLDEQVIEDLREVNEAHHLILAHEDELGGDDDELEEHADAITLTCYFVYVEVEHVLLDMERNIAQADDVKATLDDAIADREAAIADESTPEGTKDYYEDELEDLRAARSELDGVVKEGEEKLKKAQDEVKKLQDEYEAAYDALMTKVDANIEAQKKAEEGGE